MEVSISSAVSKVQKELIHHIASVEYSKAAEQFTDNGMQTDWKRMEAELNGMGAAWLLGGVLTLTPGQLVALSSLIQNRTEPGLTINVDLPGDDHRAASMTAALCVFFDALGYNIHLRELTLQVGPSLLATSRPQAVKRLQVRWRLVLKRALAAFSVNVVLREFRLEVPAPLAHEGDAQTLEATMTATPRRQRLAVLMGTHKRVGADSPFRWIPHNVLQSIVEMAIPKTPCKLDFSTVPVPGMMQYAGPDLFVVQEFL